MFELAGHCGESWNVREAYGLPLYCGVLALRSIYYEKVYKEGHGSNLCDSWRRVLRRESGVLEFLVTTVCFCAAGFAARNWHFWTCSLQISEQHMHRHENLVDCETDLAVSVWEGVVIEFFAYAASPCVDYLLNNRLNVRENFSWLLLMLSDAVYVFFFVDLSGSYGNPVDASAQHFRCDGLSDAEFALIYWLSPLAAATACFLLFESKTKVD